MRAFRNRQTTRGEGATPVELKHPPRGRLFEPLLTIPKRPARPIAFLISTVAMIWLNAVMSYGVPVHDLQQLVSPGGNYNKPLPPEDGTLPAYFKLTISPADPTHYYIASISMTSEGGGWTAAAAASAGSYAYEYTYDPEAPDMAYKHAHIEGELEPINPLPPTTSGSGILDKNFTVDTVGSPIQTQYDVEPDVQTVYIGQPATFHAYKKVGGDPWIPADSYWTVGTDTNYGTGMSITIVTNVPNDFGIIGQIKPTRVLSDTATLHVKNVDLIMPPYLGIDMTDPTNSPVDSVTASVTPDLPGATYAWSLPAPENAILTPAGHTATVKEKGAASSSYQLETVQVSIGAPYSQTLQTNFTIVRVDIEMQGRDETNEETTGVYLCYNGDDDNTNGVPDVTDTIAVTNENDLVPLAITLYPSGLPPTQTVAVAASSGIKLYEDAQKQTTASNNYPVAAFPLTLWAEGASVSTTVTDQHITAKFNPRPNAQDRVNATIIKVDIDDAGVRDTDDLQIQHFENNNGTFTYTAIPYQIYYTIEPDTGWAPDNVLLKIRDASGAVIRTKLLSVGTGIGQQQATWDGQDDSGAYPEYGSNTYTAEIVVNKGATVCSDKKIFSIFEIRQGNCLYRACSKFGIYFEHSAVLYEYSGGNEITDLQDDDKYVVAEHPGDDEDDTWTSNYGDYDTWIGADGAYCPDALKGTGRRAKRKAILENCYYLVQETIPYCLTDVLYWKGSSWGGLLSDVEQLRCDGMTEAAYEAASVRLYGANAWWNIIDAGGAAGTSLYRHNNNTSSSKKLTPERQRHMFDGSGTTNTDDDLYKP